MNERLEIAQLLARFKLHLKRSLGQSVDLERLERDHAYARQRLAEIEEDALDEDLLVMVLRLRDIVLPAASAAPPVPDATPPAADAPVAGQVRNYLMGARSW